MAVSFAPQESTWKASTSSPVTSRSPGQHGRTRIGTIRVGDYRVLYSINDAERVVRSRASCTAATPTTSGSPTSPSDAPSRVPLLHRGESDAGRFPWWRSKHVQAAPARGVHRLRPAAGCVPNEWRSAWGVTLCRSPQRCRQDRLSICSGSSAVPKGEALRSRCEVPSVTTSPRYWHRTLPRRPGRAPRAAA